jgi:hypothetical protein
VLLTALVDDVEGGVRDVVVFEEVFGRAGERADEDRVVLWGDEGDGCKAQVRLRRHRENDAQSSRQWLQTGTFLLRVSTHFSHPQAWYHTVH